MKVMFNFNSHSLLSVFKDYANTKSCISINRDDNYLCNDCEIVGVLSSNMSSSNRAIAAAAIGGAMATINTIALVAVVVFLCLRYRYGPISIRAVLRWALCKIDKIVSRIVTGPAINTSSNEAYTDVEEGERQSDVYESVAVPGGEQRSHVEENEPPSTPEQSTGINDGVYEVMAVISTP